MKTRIAEKFQTLFQTEGEFFASAGRINLIGEHTDYNGGFVFPGAIDKGMIAEIKLNDTEKVRAFALDLDEYCEFGLNDVAVDDSGEYAAQSLDTQRQRSYVQQQQILYVAAQNACLNSRTDGNALVGVDALEAFLANEVLTLAMAYETVVPEIMQDCVENFLENLFTPVTIVYPFKSGIHSGNCPHIPAFVCGIDDLSAVEKFPP